MYLGRSVIGALLLVCLVTAAAAPQQPATESRINLGAKPGTPPRPITLDDIVSLREVVEVQLSPAGDRVAFTVRQGFRDSNVTRTALYTTTVTRPGEPLKLLEDRGISSIRWTPDGRFISYLSPRSGTVQLWKVSPESRRHEQVLSHRPGAGRTLLQRFYSPADTTGVGINAYEWSPDGGRIAFTTTGPDDGSLGKAQREGVVYDDAWMSYTNLKQSAWTRPGMELWVYDVAAVQERRVWRHDRDIDRLAWSPDGSRIAVEYLMPPVQEESQIFFNHDIGILTLSTGRFLPFAAGEAHHANPTWSPDGRSLAFISGLTVQRESLVVADATSRRELAGVEVGRWVSTMWWGDDPNRIVIEAVGSAEGQRGKGVLLEVSLRDKKVRQVARTADHLSQCSASNRLASFACIRESSTIPPDPALVNPVDGSVRVLAVVNPEFASITLAPVTELRWKNEYGAETNGYLVRPLRYEKGRRYPLLVITYGFKGSFAAQAEWITSYPAQAFARDGFAVLMVNQPRYDDWHGADFAKGSRAEGYSPLASIEAGVELLVSQGLVDHERLGILGWSYGCFLTHFAVTNSTLFRAASAGEGGDYNPGIYWILGGKHSRRNYERVLGGPPYGRTLQNWLKFSPAFNAHRTRTAVLMEFAGQNAPFGLEMYTAFRAHKVPVEFVVYPDEGHIFSQPQHRYHSMRRNLDWFNYWLQGKQDPDSTKREQYSRWGGLRQQFDLLMRSSSPGQQGESTTH